MKSFLSRAVRFYKRSIKKLGACLAVKLFRSKSYAICGIPAGISSVDDQIKQIIPSTRARWGCFPRIGTHLDEKFSKWGEEMEFQAYSFYVLKEGIATALGGHLNRQGKLITTHLSLPGGVDVLTHPLFNFSLSRFFPKILKIDKPLESLTATWQGAFYHWMWQVLPRLAFLDKKDLIFIDQSHSFQRESLQLLGFTNFIDASCYDAVYSPEIRVSSIERRGSTPHGCNFLRARLLSLLKKEGKKPLYISRADAKTRRLTNEEEVFAYLRARGYERVILSEFSLLEQMSLFCSAEEIVTTHGAALSHLVFCDPQTRVIEIFHKNYVNHCYWQIASLVDLAYIPLFDSSSSSLQDPDITVDMTQLRQALDYAY